MMRELAAPTKAEVGRRRRRWNYGLGLNLLVALLLAPLLYRAGLESSIWMDETYSLLMAHHDLDAIIDQSMIDNHPPGYYVILRGWLGIGRSIGLEPGILWARLPGVMAWLGLVAAAWFIGRREFGRQGGQLLAGALALAASGAVMAREARFYALAAAALLVCFLLLLRLRRMSTRPWRARAGWSLYAACATLALWNHLLTGVVLAWLGLMWLVLLVGLPRERRASFLLGGLLAQGMALLAFSPWLPMALINIGNLESSRSWMTEPSLWNFLRVFILWYPLSRRGQPPGWEVPDWQLALGALTVLLPALAWLVMRHRRPGVSRRWRRLAGWGLGLSVANVWTIWLLGRTGTLLVFHGPRYTMLTLPIWVCGMAAVAAMGARGRVRAWLLMLPWLVASLTGWALDTFAERAGSTRLAEAAAGARLPEPGGRLYAMPAELIPFKRQSLAQWDVRPIEALVDEPVGDATIPILLLNNWAPLAQERELVARELLLEGGLARRVEQLVLPMNADQDVWLWVEGLDQELARRLAQQDFLTYPIPAPADAHGQVHPRQLRLRDGWHLLQIYLEQDKWKAYRRASAPRARIGLPGPFERGDYRVHMMLELEHATALEFHFKARDLDERKSMHITPGIYQLAMPLTLANAADDIDLFLIQSAGPSAGLIFLGLWVERAP